MQTYLVSGNEKSIIENLVNALNNQGHAGANAVIIGAERSQKRLLDMARAVQSGRAVMAQQNGEAQSNEVPRAGFNPATPKTVNSETGSSTLSMRPNNGPRLVQGPDHAHPSIPPVAPESYDDDELDEEEEINENPDNIGFAELEDNAVADDDFDDEEDESGDPDDELEDEGGMNELIEEGDSNLEDEANSDVALMIQEANIEHLHFTYEVGINVYLDNRDIENYEFDGKHYNARQPLRRGDGTEKNPYGAMRLTLNNFVDALRSEGESVKMAVAVPSTVAERYIDSQNQNVQDVLGSVFPHDIAPVYVTSLIEETTGPWDSKALLVTRNVELHFGIPAVVQAARKGRDVPKMLEQNLKILKNLVNQLKDSSNISSVNINLLIAEDVLVEGDIQQVFTGFLSQGIVPTLNNGFAKFTVKETEETSEAEEE